VVWSLDTSTTPEVFAMIKTWSELTTLVVNTPRPCLSDQDGPAGDDGRPLGLRKYLGARGVVLSSLGR
ncbi:hypothetical protein, partial [Streptomyces vinaceus]|uniref:hypothetical protein n=1 Tax=Streptomyces vinaceus TaxID=1960 RepID=UPI0037FED9F4